MNTTHSFVFSDISEKKTKFRFTNHYTRAISDCSLRLNDNAFLVSGLRTPSLAADALDIATAVSAADRLAVDHEGLSSVIDVCLPLRNPEVFNRPNVVNAIADTLYWFTGNIWNLTFTKRKTTGRTSESQTCLFPTAQHTSVCLWSGGLDAYAGAYNFLRGSDRRLCLVGVSTSNIVHRSLQTSAASLSEISPDRLDVVRVPIVVAKTINLPKNSSQRARGFVFLMVGLAYALAIATDELLIFENGYGAINLPFTSAELGLDHARSVHPISLLKMQNLFSQITGRTMKVSNPYIFVTKAEMCQKIISDNKSKLLFSTSSCDRQHRSTPSQCGMCSSCLLRQLAIISNGISDTSGYVATRYKSESKDEKIDVSHFKAMDFQASVMNKYLRDPEPWGRLVEQYETLPDVSDALFNLNQTSHTVIQSNLVRLYKEHTNQWFANRAYLTSADIQ